MKIVIAYVIAWAIAFIFAGIFQCRPVQGLWNKLIPAKCVSIRGYSYSMAGIGISQDFIILILPLREITALPMTPKKKLHMLVLFGIGGL